MTIRIRQAEAGDLAILAGFGLALGQVHVAFDSRRFLVPEGGAQAWRAFFGDEIEKPETVFLLAEEETAPVGYAFVRLEPPSMLALCGASAWLHDVYVDPRYRGRGAGRQLIDAAIEAARRLGSTNLMLGVSPSNTVARKFYERLGMRATMIEMRLELNR